MMVSAPIAQSIQSPANSSWPFKHESGRHSSGEGRQRRHARGGARKGPATRRDTPRGFDHHHKDQGGGNATPSPSTMVACPPTRIIATASKAPPPGTASENGTPGGTARASPSA